MTKKFSLCETFFNYYKYTYVAETPTTSEKQLQQHVTVHQIIIRKKLPGLALRLPVFLVPTGAAAHLVAAFPSRSV